MLALDWRHLFCLVKEKKKQGTEVLVHIVAQLLQPSVKLKVPLHALFIEYLFCCLWSAHLKDCSWTLNLTHWFKPVTYMRARVQHVWPHFLWKTFVADNSVSRLWSAVNINPRCLFTCSTVIFQYIIHPKWQSHTFTTSWTAWNPPETVNWTDYCGWYNNNRNCNGSWREYTFPTAAQISWSSPLRIINLSFMCPQWCLRRMQISVSICIYVLSQSGEKA